MLLLYCSSSSQWNHVLFPLLSRSSSSQWNHVLFPLPSRSSSSQWNHVVSTAITFIVLSVKPRTVSTAVSFIVLSVKPRSFHCYHVHRPLSETTYCFHCHLMVAASPSACPPGQASFCPVNSSNSSHCWFFGINKLALKAPVGRPDRKGCNDLMIILIPRCSLSATHQSAKVLLF